MERKQMMLFRFPSEHAVVRDSQLSEDGTVVDSVASRRSSGSHKAQQQRQEEGHQDEDPFLAAAQSASWHPSLTRPRRLSAPQDSGLSGWGETHEARPGGASVDDKGDATDLTNRTPRRSSLQQRQGVSFLLTHHEPHVGGGREAALPSPMETVCRSGGGVGAASVLSRGNPSAATSAEGLPGDDDAEAGKCLPVADWASATVCKPQRARHPVLVGSEANSHASGGASIAQKSSPSRSKTSGDNDSGRISALCTPSRLWGATSEEPKEHQLVSGGRGHDGSAEEEEDDDPNTAVTLENVMRAGPAPYTAAGRVGGGNVTVFTQCLALMERTMQQYWRNKLSMLAEIVVPLIFILVVIVLNIAFGSERILEINPIYSRAYVYQTNSEDYLTYLCYNGTTPVGNLRSCSKHVPESVRCEGDERGLPVKGLCYINVFGSATVLVTQFVEALASPLVALPTLDAIIAHQWMAKKAQLASDSRTRTALAALSTVGLGVSSSTRYDSITHSGKLLFAPRVNVPSDLIPYLNTVSSLFSYTHGGVFDTVADAEAYANTHGGDITSNESIWGVVDVRDLTEGFDVTIELHSKALPAAQPTVSPEYRSGFGFDGSDMYLASGYASLQRALYDYYLTSLQKRGVIAPAFNFTTAYPMVAPFPFISGERHYVIELAGPLIAFIVVLAFLYPYSQMVKRVVLEKELRLREAMLVMGLKRTSLWLCFFVMTLLELVLISILVTALLCATVVVRSDPFVVLLMLVIFSCTLVPLVGIVSVFFSKARLAALMSPLLFFAMSMLIFSMTNAEGSAVLVLSILSPTALAALLTSMTAGEAGSGFGSGSFSGVSFYTPLPYRILLMLAVDVFLYTILMLYLDAVVPQEWGSTRHPLFFILEPWELLKAKCSCRSGHRRQSRRGSGVTGEAGNGSGSSSSSSGDGDGDGDGSSSGDEADDPQGVAGANEASHNSRNGSGTTPATRPLASDPNRFDSSVGIDPTTGKRKPVSIQLKKLFKQYKRSGKAFTAVDELSWDLFPGEISVLLGPNGSGKSTSISMMTGMLSPDRGDCVITGHSIREALSAARHELGFCPQHNILWPDSTCREHLEFFAKIKGLRGAELEDAIMDVLRAVDLADKANHTPSMLSGGQKRKLSVAIAFVGRNRVVLLDEPTSGMDAAARRHTWSLLRAMAPNHTILLTTHYMDEADLLGDHIAILNEGRLQCAGSSLFLRSHAGSGYTLRFDLLPVLASAVNALSGTTRATPLELKWDAISRSVELHIPEAEATLRTSTEMEFCIPLSSKRQLPALLRELEQKGNREMGIRSYALSAPTLEDVFMNIVESAHLEEGEAQTSSLAVTEAAKLTAGSSSTATTLARSARSSGPLVCSPHGEGAAPSPTATPGASAAKGVNPFLYRHMSRASFRFISGEVDPSAGGAAAAFAYHEPADGATRDGRGAAEEEMSAGAGADSDDDTRFCSPLRSGGEKPNRGGGAAEKSLGFTCFSDDVFGQRLDSPRGEPRKKLTYGNSGSSPLSVVHARRSEALGARSTEREGCVHTPSNSANADPEAVLLPTVLRVNSGSNIMGDGFTSGSAICARPSSLSALTPRHPRSGTLGKALVEYPPLRELTARADQSVDRVWSVRPVEGKARRWGLQFEAMLYKRFFYSLRDRRMQFFQVVCPVMCILLAMLLQLVNTQFTGTLDFDAAQLFKQRTLVELARCGDMFGPTTLIEALFPADAKDAVRFVDRQFAYSGDLGDYLLDTWYTHEEGRYAAVQCIDPVVNTSLQANFPTVVKGMAPYIVLFNTSSRHSLPYTLSTVFQLLYNKGRYLAGHPPDAVRSSVFRTGVKALPLRDAEVASDSALSSIMIGILVLIPFTFLPANPVAWVVKEREVRARHLQKLSGLPYLLYWLGNFVFDFAAYLVSMLLVIAVFSIFRRWEYVGRDTIGATVVSFLLYGLCCCTGSYAVSFCFTEHTTAQVAVMGISFLTGFVCVVLVFILGMMDWTKDASDVMRWIFRVIPTYSVGEVILGLALLQQNQLMEPELQPWSLRVTGWADVYMAAEVPVFVAVTLLWDHPNRRALLQSAKDSLTRHLCCCRRGRRANRCEAGSPGSGGLAEDPALPDREAARSERLHGSSGAARLSPPGHRQTQRQRQSRTEDRANRSASPSPVAAAATAEGEARSRGNSPPRSQPKRAHVFADCALQERSAFEPAARKEPDMDHPQPLGDADTGSASLRRPLSPSAATATATGVCHSRSAAVPFLAVDDLMASTEQGGRSTTAAAAATTATTTTPHTVAVPLSFRFPKAAIKGEPLPPVPCMYPAPALEEEDYIAKEEEDSDVEDERLAVYRDERAQCTQNAVRLVDLRKVYPNGKVAVRNLSFGVMHGEVFGFLGTNGAGKSTALSIITQEQLPTSGRAYIGDHDVVHDSVQAMRRIGYCPQFDACFDLLTVEQHLHLYSRIRGVQRERREELVAALLELCDLATYKSVLSSELSGGNRRKLSVAMALLGAPEVVCLDEPSAGMDPIARRLLWRALDRVSKKCSIVLTTHHLEEVEALADTVAIMVNGGLRCIGDLTHLKHKYAKNAYELCIRVGGGGGGGTEAAERHRRHRRGKRPQSASSATHADAEEKEEEEERRSPYAMSFAGRRVHSVSHIDGDSPTANARTAKVTGNDGSLKGHLTQRSRCSRSHSITYAGTDFIDTGNDVVQFMAKHLPSAVLVESFNDERYVYSIPATRDVARAMAAMQEELQRRGSRYGTLLGSSRCRNALCSSFSAAVLEAPQGAAADPIVRLSEVFRLLQEHQERLGITEYSVSQVSLEQVFLRVVHDEGDAESGSHRKHRRHSPKAEEPRRELPPDRDGLAASPSHQNPYVARPSCRRSASQEASTSAYPRHRAASIFQVLSLRNRSTSLPDGSRGTTHLRSRADNYAEYRRVKARALQAAKEMEAKRRRFSEPGNQG